MLVVIVVVIILSVLAGIALSVALFGTGGKRSKVFKDIYFSVEDVDGKGVIYTKLGEYSVILKIENPVRSYCSDTGSYYSYVDVFESLVQLLGEGYALHKQDIFARDYFDMPLSGQPQKFLSDSNFKFFRGRSYMSMQTYLIVTQENKRSTFKGYDPNKWRDFLVKSGKVYDLLSSSGIEVSFLGKEEATHHVDRYFGMDFTHEVHSMTDFRVDSDFIHMGNRKLKIYSLLDVDEVGLGNTIRPYGEISINNVSMPLDLMHDLSGIPGTDLFIYNQVIFGANQRLESNRLEKKKNNHKSFPSAVNQQAVEDISQAQDTLVRESKQLVYAHFNLVVSGGERTDFDKVTNYIENVLSRHSIHISQRAYNQLELFVGSFPGNCYRLSKDYDRFLMLCPAALCLMYKESMPKGDDSTFKCYLTDRQGLPLAIDMTGKEGKVHYTDNSNFFILGPSGSGKSFFTNTLMCHYYEQNTDVVIVDTGDSYEGLCSHAEGTYITYSKDNPISMNPFKVTEIEYKENFGEKKNFLKSLIFVIFKGKEVPTKIEDTIINQVIVEYYREYFSPFEGFSNAEREDLHQRLLLQAKRKGEYEQFEQKLEERNAGSEYIVTAEDKERYERTSRVVEKLKGVVADDSGASEGEISAASRKLALLTPELVQGKFMEKIEREIIREESRRKRLHVTKLNFNTFYEFALERIPQIMRENDVKFAIADFAHILAPFYRGGEFEYTLNNDMSSSLFDERFIVFEIDKIKDDPTLFPIVVLIIMDVFTQKMRIKKGRKCLVIEEAWKAIATPVMAAYIQYLYKTARKHWAMVGVVTQELQDITGNQIVKDAIINNSGVFMLLDQSKFMDKFDDIKSTLALSDIDCKKISTINRLDNKDGRNRFSEVFVKRGYDGDVFGVEVSRECYMTFTTEKIEKEALRLYKQELRCNHLLALQTYISDWDRSGISSSRAFAERVMSAGHVLHLSQRKD